MGYGITALIIFGVTIISILGLAVYTKIYKMKGFTMDCESKWLDIV